MTIISPTLPVLTSTFGEKEIPGYYSFPSKKPGGKKMSKLIHEELIADKIKVEVVKLKKVRLGERDKKTHKQERYWQEIRYYFGSKRVHLEYAKTPADASKKVAKTLGLTQVERVKPTRNNLIAKWQTNSDVFFHVKKIIDFAESNTKNVYRATVSSFNLFTFTYELEAFSDEEAILNMRSLSLNQYIYFTKQFKTKIIKPYRQKITLKNYVVAVALKPSGDYVLRTYLNGEFLSHWNTPYLTCGAANAIDDAFSFLGWHKTDGIKVKPPSSDESWAINLGDVDIYLDADGNNDGTIACSVEIFVSGKELCTAQYEAENKINAKKQAAGLVF